jgi:hypothetical protein
MSRLFRRYVLYLITICLLTVPGGCTLVVPTPTSVPPPQIRLPSINRTPSAAATPTYPPAAQIEVTGGYELQDYPGDLVDALPVMSGICFEAAYDAAGEVFVLRSADDHINLYNLADNSGLCRQPVTRYPFVFSQGAVLAGGWSYGTGCTARHEVTRYDRNPERKIITIETRFITEGDCPYNLVRPFWVGIPDAQDYEIVVSLNGQ